MIFAAWTDKRGRERRVEVVTYDETEAQVHIHGPLEYDDPPIYYHGFWVDRSELSKLAFSTPEEQEAYDQNKE